MKLYRNHNYAMPDCSYGYTWHPTKAAAIAAHDPEEFEDDPILGRVAQEFEVTPTKAGILALLNSVANYPDNG